MKSTNILNLEKLEIEQLFNDIQNIMSQKNIILDKEIIESNKQKVAQFQLQLDNATKEYLNPENLERIRKEERERIQKTSELSKKVLF